MAPADYLAVGARTAEGSIRNGALAVLGVAALAWPLYGNQIETVLVRDDPDCPQSGDFPATTGDLAAAAQVVCLVNRQRADHGLPALTENPQLDRAAQLQADDIARRRFFAHVNPDGVTPDQRMKAAGYQGPVTGENLAWGGERHGTPVEIVKSWMNSPGHRANILQPRFTEIGTGVTRGAPRDVQGRAAIYVNNFGGGR